MLDFEFDTDGLSFKLGRAPNVILRVTDGASFLDTSDTFDARQYAAWLAKGNIPDPADPIPIEVILNTLGIPNEIEDRAKAQLAINKLEKYINDESPTNASTVGIVKLMCRIMIWIIKRLA